MPEYTGDDNFSPIQLVEIVRLILGKNHFKQMHEVETYLEEWCSLCSQNLENNQKIKHSTVGEHVEIILKLPIFVKELRSYKLEIPTIFTKNFSTGFNKTAKKNKLTKNEKELILNELWNYWGWLTIKRYNNYRIQRQIELKQLSAFLKTDFKNDLKQSLNTRLPHSLSRVPKAIANSLLKKIEKEIELSIKELGLIAKNDPISNNITKYIKTGRPTSEAFIQFIIQAKKILQVEGKYMDRLIPLMQDLKTISPDLFKGITINENNIRVLISKKINKSH